MWNVTEIIVIFFCIFCNGDYVITSFNPKQKASYGEMIADNLVNFKSYSA